MTQADICKHEGIHVLLVEGKNDCHVILALCKSHGLPEAFGIYQCENDDAVLKRLNALIVQPDGPKIIGAVVDADNPNLISRWQQIKDKLKHHSLLFPEDPDQKGTVIENNFGKPRLGIWLMPDNQESGMLEDFLMRMAPPEAISVSQECVEIAKQRGVIAFKEAHHSKAVLHTYLAWQDEPGKPLGQSITSHALRSDTENARAFVAWLKRLFY